MRRAFLPMVESIVSEAWRASHRNPRLTRACSTPQGAGQTSRRSERAPCRHAPAPSRPARVESRGRVPARAPFLGPKVVTPPPARRKPVSGGGRRARLPSRSRPRALHALYPHLSRVASALVAPLIRTCRVLHPHFSHAASALVAISDRIGRRLRLGCLRPRKASQTIAAVATEHHPAQGRHPPPPACGRGIQGEGSPAWRSASARGTRAWRRLHQDDQEPGRWHPPPQPSSLGEGGGCCPPPPACGRGIQGEGALWTRFGDRGAALRPEPVARTQDGLVPSPSAFQGEEGVAIRLAKARDPVAPDPFPALIPSRALGDRNGTCRGLHLHLLRFAPVLASDCNRSSFLLRLSRPRDRRAS